MERSWRVLELSYPIYCKKRIQRIIIQSLVDCRENDDSTIAQDMTLRHHIANLNRRVTEYHKSLMKDL